MSRKPKNRVLENILVEDYAAEGRSLARVDGKVIFIEGAVPGDRVDIQLLKSKKDWGEGRVTRFYEYAHQRSTPFCRHFGICGGCKWQMLPYEQQLKYKQREAEENLRRIGRIELPPVATIIGSENDRFYRNKLEFTFSNRRYLLPEEMGDMNIVPGPVLGFHVPGWYEKVMDIEECYLMPEPVNEIRNAIRAFALEQNYPFYDLRSQAGWLRLLILRMTTTGELMLNVVMGYDDEQRNQLLGFIASRFPQITTLLYTINGKKNDSIHDLEPVVWKGDGYITEQLEQYRFRIGPKSFFQTNTKQAERLYSVARDFTGATGKEVIYDLYCGTGSIGIFCSRLAAKIIGVELIPEAVEDAARNAALNNVQHAQFFAGDVVRVCDDDFFAAHGRPDVVITDPPRAGMHEKLVHKILEMEAPVVVYISCNTATQARDLQWLNEKYQVTAVQPVDMFPHTHHIENVVQLRLR